MFRSIDLIFTYWMLIWFFVYYFTPYKKYSPKLVFILGLIINLFLLILLIINKTPLKFTLGFIFAICLTKGIPLYLMRNEKILVQDFYFTLFIFSVYLLYFFLKEKNSLTKRKNDLKNFFNGKTNSPIMNYFSK